MSDEYLKGIMNRDNNKLEPAMTAESELMEHQAVTSKSADEVAALAKQLRYLAANWKLEGDLTATVAVEQAAILLQCMTEGRPAPADTLLGEETVRLAETLKALADAADRVGVRFFDTDTMEPEVEAMQAATIKARELLAAFRRHVADGEPIRDVQRLDNCLDTISRTVQSWLDWQAREWAAEGKEPSPETHVWRFPSNPPRIMFENWIKLFAEVRAALAARKE